MTVLGVCAIECWFECGFVPEYSIAACGKDCVCASELVDYLIICVYELWVLVLLCGCVRHARDFRRSGYMGISLWVLWLGYVHAWGCVAVGCSVLNNLQGDGLGCVLSTELCVLFVCEFCLHEVFFGSFCCNVYLCMMFAAVEWLLITGVFGCLMVFLSVCTVMSLWAMFAIGF
eukprot:gene3040-2022_t